MNEIHICNIKNGVLYIPREVGIPDGEYVLMPGVRCNFSLMTHTAFENAMKNLTESPDDHKRLLRHIFSHAVMGEVSGQKISVPISFIENADLKDCATVEFWK